MDASINGVFEWFRSLLVTFYHALFKPHTFFHSLFFNNRKAYVDAHIYLVIGVGVTFSIQSAFVNWHALKLSGADEMIIYIDDFYNSGSLFTRTLYILPTSLLIYLICYFVAHILLKEISLRRKFRIAGVYWITSYVVFFSISKFVIAIFRYAQRLYVYNEGLSNSPEHELAKTDVYVTIFFVLLHSIGYLLPAYAVIKFFGFTDRRWLRFSTLSILVGWSPALMFSLIRGEVQVVSFFRGNDLEVWQSHETKSNYISFEATHVGNSVYFHGSAFLYNRSDEDMFIDYSGGVLSIDSVNNEIREFCTTYFNKMKYLSLEIAPIYPDELKMGEFFILEAKSRVPVYISFSMEFLPYELACFGFKIFYISLPYRLIRDDIRYYPDRFIRQRVFTNLDDYSDCSSSGKTPIDCKNGYFDIIKSSNEYQKVLQLYQINNVVDTNVISRLTMIGSPNSFHDSTYCSPFFTFQLDMVHPDSIQYLANFSFYHLSKRLLIYDDSLYHLREIDYDRSLLNSISDVCFESF